MNTCVASWRAVICELSVLCIDGWHCWAKIRQSSFSRVAFASELTFFSLFVCCLFIFRLSSLCLSYLFLLCLHLLTLLFVSFLCRICFVFTKLIFRLFLVSPFHPPLSPIRSAQNFKKIMLIEILTIVSPWNNRIAGFLILKDANICLLLFFVLFFPRVILSSVTYRTPSSSTACLKMSRR